MTKKEFITFLNQRLSILNERERREIIDEYVQHIDLKIEEGKTEAEAIRDFGDLNEFVDEILEAYHVNPKANSAENFIVDLVNKIANGISAIANSIVSMKSDKIISLIIEVFLLIIVLAVVRWPFRLILEAFFSILFFLPYGIERLFVFIFDICYAIIALAVMYTFIKKRAHLDDESVRPRAARRTARNMNQQRYSKTETKMEEEEVEEEIIIEEEGDVIEIVETPKKKEPQVERRNRTMNEDRSNPLLTISVGIVKVFMALFMIPFVFVSFGLIIAVAFLVAFLVKGIGSLGILMIFLGFTILSIALVSGIGRFIFGGRK